MHLEILYEDDTTDAEIMMMLKESTVWSMEAVITVLRRLRAVTIN